MSHEEIFGAFIDWREDIQQQLKIIAEGITFNGNPKLTAKPTDIPDNSTTLNWSVFDEDGSKRADVIFTKRPEQRHFSIQGKQRIEVDSMLYYSVKVCASEEIFIR